jgi:GT2 family glycosyltransferase
MGVTAAADKLALTAAVCTRNRPDQLRRALASLAVLDPPAGEILVIDNAPDDDRSRRLVASEFPAVRYVRENVPGLNFARNRALHEARCPIVGFLDDDAVADAGWCQALLSVFAERPAVAACTGRVEALVQETAAQRLFEANGGFSCGLDPIRLPADLHRPLHGHRAPAIAWSISIGCGCSLGIRRAAALAVGGFDNALDLSPLLPGGGDLDILWRLLDAGHHLEYQPLALAWHEHRRTLPEVGGQLAGHQRAVLAFLRKSLREARKETRWAILLFLAWRLVKPGVRALRRLFGRDPLPFRVLVRMWWNSWVGVFAYRAAEREAARRLAAATAEGLHPCGEPWRWKGCGRSGSAAN